MSGAVDEYIDKVVKLGDAGSELLAALCTPTLKNNSYVDVVTGGMGGLAVLRIPERYNAVVHTTSGDANKLNVKEHAASLMDNLYSDAEKIGSKPLALVDVIDASIGDKKTIKIIGKTLVSRANENDVAIINGELAILGSRVACDANISGTMIGMISDSMAPGVYQIKGTKFVVFNPGNNVVHGNADGVGTKTEFDERAGKYVYALYDSLPTKLDDSAKNGARARCVFDVVERSGEIPVKELDAEAKKLGRKLGFEYVLVHKDVGNRLQGWRLDEPTYNVNGVVVTVIDEERLKNPLRPQSGNYLVAIRRNPSPRANGITDKRKAMVKVLGEEWHNTKAGIMFMEFLVEPSIIFYPVFNELIDKRLATSVYHMSGGAYNGKLARPLAKNNLYVTIENLFKPDWRELALAGFSLTSAEVAYAKWPMGNEGFITTNLPDEAIGVISTYGLDAQVAGRVEKAKRGRTGVSLVGVRGSDGKDVYFSGK